MKKLMIGAAIALAAICSQGAATAWGFAGGCSTASDTEGTGWFTGATAFLYTGTVSFDEKTGWDLTKANFIASAPYDDVFGAYGELDIEKLNNYSAVPLEDTTTQPYKLILVDGKATDLGSYTGDGKHYYMAAADGTVTTDPTESGSVTYVNISNYDFVYGDMWQSAATSVPEPTSGLLLLLGVAGLALKRRRA